MRPAIGVRTLRRSISPRSASIAARSAVLSPSSAAACQRRPAISARSVPASAPLVRHADAGAGLVELGAPGLLDLHEGLLVDRNLLAERLNLRRGGAVVGLPLAELEPLGQVVDLGEHVAGQDLRSEREVDGGHLARDRRRDHVGLLADLDAGGVADLVEGDPGQEKPRDPRAQQDRP